MNLKKYNISEEIYNEIKFHSLSPFSESCAFTYFVGGIRLRLPIMSDTHFIEFIYDMFVDLLSQDMITVTLVGNDEFKDVDLNLGPENIADIIIDRWKKSSALFYPDILEVVWIYQTNKSLKWIDDNADRYNESDFN